MPFSTFGGLINHATSSTGAEILDNAREFIKDKLYFASLSFTPSQYPHIHFFSIDQQLVYVNFYSDFGPSNLSHVIRFCELLQEKFRNPATANKKICLYSSMENDKRANAAFLICAYLVVVQNKTPEEAYQSLMGVSPAFIPYRDAGYGAATYYITVLDCIRGLHRAMTLGILDLEHFDVDEYEYYEKVENGDFNWIAGKFLALATPKDEPLPLHYQQMQQQQLLQQQQQQQAGSGLFNTGLNMTNFFYGSSGNGNNSSMYNTGRSSVTGSSSQQQQSSLTAANAKNKFYSAYSIDNLIRYMKEKNIKTIIRLNNKTYDKRKFVEAGIEHIELYFPDGTTPPDGILKRFLEICESREGPIAVHCKAGLGRTGTLIASFLMKHYKLTACETISFLRVIRPGSVVGPQQNYLQAMQSKLWKMHPSSKLSPAVACWKPPTYPNLTRFGPPLVVSGGASASGVTIVPPSSTALMSVNGGHGTHASSSQQTLGQRYSAVSASGDIYMPDATHGSVTNLASASDEPDTRRDIAKIRGGYMSVDAYEAELEREREKASLAIEELLIPVQPRKAPMGGGVAPPGARISPNPELWRRNNAQNTDYATQPTSSSSTQQQPPHASYNQSRYTTLTLQQQQQQQLQQQQQQSRYNLRSQLTPGVGDNTGTSTLTNTVPRSTINSGVVASDESQTKVRGGPTGTTTSVDPPVTNDTMNGFVLVGGRISAMGGQGGSSGHANGSGNGNGNSGGHGNSRK